MAQAVGALVRRERGAPNPKRFRGAVRHQRQARIEALKTLREWVLGAEAFSPLAMARRKRRSASSGCLRSHNKRPTQPRKDIREQLLGIAAEGVDDPE
jgi:hypothetical protein